MALQEFLDGDEYIVDCISSNGKHIVVAIWTQGKRRDLPWNPTSIITTHNNLGFKHGISHNELMFTERGPILIEINARMHGVQAPGLVEMSTGTNLADSACDVFVGGCEKFNSCYRAPPATRFMYPVVKNCYQVVLCCPRQGYYKSPLKERILAMKLPSVIEVLTAKGVNDFQPQSIDLPTSPGTVLMVHESLEQLETDGIYILSSRPRTKSMDEPGNA